MWNGPHLSRIFVLPKAIAFSCFFLLLTVQTWAQIENETFEHAFGLHYWDNKENRESQFTESNENDVHVSQEGILRPSFEGENMLESENHDVDNHKEAIEKIIVVPPVKEDVPNDVKDDVTFSTGISARIGGGKAKNSDSPEADRYAPRPDDTVPNYVLTETRLKQIRSKFMYWFFDKGGANNEGDYQKEIQAPMPQVHKNFNFQLPFYGFIFNYTRVSMNGYLEFSDPPTHYTYPLVFPVKDWPKENDPSFIGIFFSKCRIGKIRPTDIDQRKPGVYFRLERDLQRKTDQFGVEMRERLKWDIREGIIGAESFEPKHAVIVTWKNVSFSGGIDSSLYKTNTFQMVLATDEMNTYVIFNYLDIQWTSHTEAGGDTVTGEGGVPAFVGFNAGNGTQSYEYTPYSQRSTIRELTRRGWANGFPGRHMFKIDKKIFASKL